MVGNLEDQKKIKKDSTKSLWKEYLKWPEFELLFFQCSAWISFIVLVMIVELLLEVWCIKSILFKTKTKYSLRPSLLFI